MFLPSPTPVPSMASCQADCSTNLLTVPGLESPFLAMSGEAGGAGRPPGRFHHVPVMREEVLHYLSPGPGMTIVDATLGGAGHALMVLEAGASLIGLDRDPDALAHARNRLEPYGGSAVLRQVNFSEMLDQVREVSPEGVDGILMDLGVSSFQLDSGGRGFSLRREGPLDMRMNPGEGVTAADIVNEWEEEELARVFRELGEERKARPIARAIVRRRGIRSFRDTLDLADCVAGTAGRRGRIHPATRVFQALRMTVNREMESLEAALESAPSLLKSGGRMAVITFHSLEDRLVKRSFKARSQLEHDRPEWPAPRPNPDCCLKLITRRPVSPTGAEVADNPRARSAKLRVAEKRREGE